MISKRRIASFNTEFAFALPQNKDLTSVIIITKLILISVTLVFSQENQTSQAADKRLDLIKYTTVIIREETGRQKRLTKEIVQRDIIHLSVSDITPLDVRLFSSNNLSVNKATSTDKEYQAEPRSWSPKSITRFTMFIGPVSSISDFSTFALLWFILGANSAENQSLFHIGLFVLGLLSQKLIVHLIRTKKTPFIQSTANRPVIIMTGLIMLVVLMIPFSNFGINIGMQPLPWSFFLWLAITLVAYCVLIELVKRWHITRFNTWL